MKNLKLNTNKQIICDLTTKLFEVENLDAKHIEDCLFTVMNSMRLLSEAEDEALIKKFVDSCNRLDISILLVERLFDETFFEVKEPTFEEVFNEKEDVAPYDIFKTLNGYFGFDNKLKL